MNKSSKVDHYNKNIMRYDRLFFPRKIASEDIYSSLIQCGDMVMA